MPDVPVWKKLLALGALTIIATGLLGLVGGNELAQNVSYALFAIFMLGAVGLMVRVAMAFEKGSAVRKHWTLIGTGVALGVAGDIVYLGQSVVTGDSPPFPSWATPVYLVQYLFFLGGLILAAGVYKMVIDLKKPALTAVAASAVATAAVIWFEANVVFGRLDTAMRNEALTFTVADIMLIFAPAFFVILVIDAVGGAKLSRPWQAVAIGAVLFAFGDVANFTLGAFSGEVDLGFAVVGMSRMASSLAFAIGALMAKDAFELRA